MSDVDVYWFKNPLPLLTTFGPGVFLAQSDEYKITGLCLKQYDLINCNILKLKLYKLSKDYLHTHIICVVSGYKLDKSLKRLKCANSHNI